VKGRAFLDEVARDTWAYLKYAEAHGHAALAQKADEVIADVDFTLWYHPDTDHFSWGDTEDPQGGVEADYYSNENRIINFVARALGQLTAEGYGRSLEALETPSGTYGGIAVEAVSWDGSYFTYAAPALFIDEMDVAFGAETVLPATEAQTAYARHQGYGAWGLSDCFDVDDGGYVQQGAPPTGMAGSPETRPGLVAPHASALALITPLSSDAITNLQTISSTFGCAYDAGYGFRDAVMTKPGDPAYGACSARFSALAQAWTLLSVATYESGFVWAYAYRDEGIRRAHREMFGEHRAYLPAVLADAASAGR
jgi:hypothetical protein